MIRLASMPHPHNIDYISDTSAYSGRKINFQIFRDGCPIKGVGSLVVAGPGARSGKMRVHIECRSFDRFKAQADLFYLDQAEFNRIQFPNLPDANLTLDTCSII